MLQGGDRRHAGYVHPGYQMNVKNAEIIYGNTWIQLDGFECLLGQLSEKWKRVQQLAIQDHKR